MAGDRDIIDFRSIIDHLSNGPLGIILMDRELRISYWSGQAEAIFGWTAAEAMHKDYREFGIVFGEDVEAVAAMIAKIASGEEKNIRFTNRNRTRSGDVVVCDWYNSALFDAGGDLRSILCLVSDVTGRAQMEHELSLIYNSAIDPMWLISIEDGDQFRFQSINRSFTEVTGLRPEQVIGKLMEEVLPETSHALVRGKYSEAIVSGEVIDYIEIAVHPAGKRYGEIRVIPVRDREGRVTQILGIANDITEKQLLLERLEKEREQVNRKLTNAAIQSQELERSKVSQELHDNVNQVLTTVKLYTELCASGTVDPRIYLPKCAALLNDTINEIRDLSKRLSAPLPGQADVTDTIQDLVTSINETGRVKIRFDASRLLRPKLDSELHLALYRIAQEHLTNVLKHAAASEVYMELSEMPGELGLLVEDNGRGFDPAANRRGIGIANMTSRARLLNGQLDIESAPGKGCRLRIRIPIKYIDETSYPANETLM